LLKRVIDDNPTADRIALFRVFVEKLNEEDDGDYMETIIAYWFANNYHSLIAARLTAEERSRSAEAGAERSEAAAQREEWIAGTTEKIREKIAEEAAVVLLDLMMPNGKSLAACTGQECLMLGRQMGGWLRKVGRRLKPNETVGDVLTESDLRALYPKGA
jgi:hypothetical protein